MCFRLLFFTSSTREASLTTLLCSRSKNHQNNNKGADNHIFTTCSTGGVAAETMVAHKNARAPVLQAKMARFPQLNISGRRLADHRNATNFVKIAK